LKLCDTFFVYLQARKVGDCENLIRVQRHGVAPLFKQLLAIKANSACWSRYKGHFRGDKLPHIEAGF
jgi:hypothetical protein